MFINSPVYEQSKQWPICFMLRYIFITIEWDFSKMDGVPVGLVKSQWG